MNIAVVCFLVLLPVVLLLVLVAVATTCQYPVDADLKLYPGPTVERNSSQISEDLILCREHDHARVTRTRARPQADPDSGYTATVTGRIFTCDDVSTEDNLKLESRPRAEPLVQPRSDDTTTSSILVIAPTRRPRTPGRTWLRGGSTMATNDPALGSVGNSKRMIQIGNSNTNSISIAATRLNPGTPGTHVSGGAQFGASRQFRPLSVAAVISLLVP
eukprot:2459975-Rhodomonas_salina.5